MMGCFRLLHKYSCTSSSFFSHLRAECEFCCLSCIRTQSCCYLLSGIVSVFKSPMSMSRYLHIIAWSDSRDASLWPLAEWISSFINKYCRLLWSVRRQQWHRVVSRPYLSEYFDKCSIKIVIIQLISEVWMWLSRQPWLSEWVYLSEPISANNRQPWSVPARWAWQIFLLGPHWAGMKPLTRKNESYSSGKIFYLKGHQLFCREMVTSLLLKCVKLFFSSLQM